MVTVNILIKNCYDYWLFDNFYATTKEYLPISQFYTPCSAERRTEQHKKADQEVLLLEGTVHLRVLAQAFLTVTMRGIKHSYLTLISLSSSMFYKNTLKVSSSSYDLWFHHFHMYWSLLSGKFWETCPPGKRKSPFASRGHGHLLPWQGHT